jgi:hypothetical protein
MGIKEDVEASKAEIMKSMEANLRYWEAHVEEFDKREAERLSKIKPVTPVHPTPKLNKDGTIASKE